MIFSLRNAARVFLCGFLVTCCVESASADLVIAFSDDNGSSFVDSIDVTTGQTVDIGLFLVDDQSGGVLETDGLLGFGLSATAFPGNFGVVTSTTISDSFDFVSTDSRDELAFEWEALVFLNAIPVGQRIHLGNFEFRSNQDGTTTFEIGDIKPGSGTANANWLTGFGDELDEQVFGAGSTGRYQLSINSLSAVPEPGSMGMFAIAALAMAGRRRRR